MTLLQNSYVANKRGVHLLDEPNTDWDQAVLLGALGWEWPEWALGFYPEDMPPEWRLTYYNTQFNCVFLPADQWRPVATDELEQWAEDTHDRFLFLLEGEEGTAVPRPLQGKALCLSAQDGRITWFDAGSDIRQLAEGLKQGEGGPRFVLSRDGDLSQLERVRTLLDLLGLMA